MRCVFEDTPNDVTASSAKVVQGSPLKWRETAWFKPPHDTPGAKLDASTLSLGGRRI